jgi:hypothetical protein
MNSLREALQDHLALRRGLGFKMHAPGLALPQFVAFMEEKQTIDSKKLISSWLRYTTGIARLKVDARVALEERGSSNSKAL